MSSVHRAATLGGLSVISASAALLTRYVIVYRASIARSLSPTTGAGLLRLILLLFSLLNIKNLPCVWHIRFLVRALLYHFRIDPKSVPPASLFEPLVTSTRAPLLECDTNLHKSNSTYFSDLDQSRAHLYACLLRKAFTREWKDDFLKPQPQLRPLVDGHDVGDGSAKEKAYSDVVKEGIEVAAAAAAEDAGARDSTSSTVLDSSTTNGVLATAPGTNSAPGSNSNSRPFPEPKGPYNMLLGSISCHYHREIPPYTRYELWSRILAWDNKWFYSVTHIVKPGVAVPKRWTMQPWRRISATRSNRKAQGSKKEDGGRNSHPNDQKSPTDAVADAVADMKEEEYETTRIKKLKESIYATSIAKVVVKRGRLTIPPEIMLQRSGLLPERPAAAAKPEAKQNVNPAEAEEEKEGIQPTTSTPNGTADPSPSSSASASQWTWHAMEQRRQQGLELANKFAELDAAQALFDGGRDGALGEYADLFWA